MSYVRKRNRLGSLIAVASHVHNQEHRNYELLTRSIMASTIRSFSRVMDKLNIQLNSPVAVAVSGGYDSLALTLLAKKVFSRVVGITVDHKASKESREDAVKVGELIQRLGLEHHTVSLDWGPTGAPLEDRVHIIREMKSKSYAALLETCEQLEIKTLLVGHHRDDLNAVFLARLLWSGEIDSLGMHPVSYWPGYPETKIVRPLLEWSKKEVVEVCRSEGVEVGRSEGVESTSLDFNLKKIWTNVLKLQPSIADDIPQLVKSTYEAQQALQKEVTQAVSMLPTLNTRFGCVYLKNSEIKELRLPIQRRVLQILANYVASYRLSRKYHIVEKVCRQLPLTEAIYMGDVVFIPMKDSLCIGKGKPTNKESIPLELGKPVLWDKRWLITVVPHRESQKKINTSKLVVRGVLRSHWSTIRHGIHRVRYSQSPHEKLRAGLPVVTAHKGKVVSVPHFYVIDWSFGVDCFHEYQPSISLEELLIPLANNI